MYIAANMARRVLTERFIEPNYDQVEGVNVGELRDAFQYISNALFNHAAGIAQNTGADIEKPNNPHRASIQHTTFLVSMDQAKDAYIKWVLACTGKEKDTPANISEKTSGIFAPPSA